jgi:competence protein ComFC
MMIRKVAQRSLSFLLQAKFWDVFYPRLCMNCSQVLDKSSSLCESCLSKLEVMPQSGFKAEFKIAELEVQNYSLIDYSPVGQSFVSVFKYDGFHRILSSTFSKKYLNAFKISFQNDFAIEDVLVPIPLHRGKLRERGFNQALAVAQFFQIHLGGEVMDLLRRTSNNKAQALQNKKRREKNSQNLFSLKSTPEVLLLKRGVWIVDDVITTGFTARSAIREFENKGVTVKGVITLSRSGYIHSIQEDWEAERV